MSSGSHYSYDTIVEHLRDGSLVAFLGAGASRAYLDAGSGQHFTGIPSGSDVVKAMAERRQYIEPSMTFKQACFLFKAKEDRGALERFLVEVLDKPVVDPLPAHRIAADLPFCAFVTTNFDPLLEDALRTARRKPHVLIEDKDVCHLRACHKPVIKLHGCIKQPDTLVAAEDEYHLLAESKPVIESVLRSLLANRMALFLGYDLQDDDFSHTFNQLRSTLRARMPRSVAVIDREDPYREALWKSRDVELVTADLTDFLRGLLRASARRSRPAIYHPQDDAFNNAYFESLLRISTLPSETQVTDAFVEHLSQELSKPDIALADVVEQAQKASDTVLEARPHYQGLRRVAESLLAALRTCSDPFTAQVTLQEAAAARRAVIERFKAKGPSLVRKGDTILLYSQSQRVLQVLSGVPRAVQDSSHIFVAECRPKSPESFQDSLSTAENLLKTGFEVTLVPDAAIGSLINRSQITRVLVGAHEVFQREGAPISFVNTCGTALILAVAEKSRIPVIVVAESGKIVDLDQGDPEPTAASVEEEDVFLTVQEVITKLKSQGQTLRSLNIGYELCHFSANVQLVSEA